MIIITFDLVNIPLSSKKLSESFVSNFFLFGGNLSKKKNKRKKLKDL